MPFRIEVIEIDETRDVPARLLATLEVTDPREGLRQAKAAWQRGAWVEILQARTRQPLCPPVDPAEAFPRIRIGRALLAA
ncbi:hypothetical protein BUE93_20235 [Chromobacterium amazonense]|uniref:Uncharacterized protein n=1 Tax=Chromobacterium amazonense TaxID=1382803 RepID=A0A2S9WZ86_9NEIS|nr:hypothetical protein [Chromobacterium amazonense]PRP68780.1 hypothetical protein BUE93_20235 [Chromobacterium amazonense]